MGKKRTNYTYRPVPTQKMLNDSCSHRSRCISAYCSSLQYDSNRSTYINRALVCSQSISVRACAGMLEWEMRANKAEEAGPDGRTRMACRQLGRRWPCCWWWWWWRRRWEGVELAMAAAEPNHAHVRVAHAHARSRNNYGRTHVLSVLLHV